MPYEPPTEDGPDPDRLRDEAWDRKHLTVPRASWDVLTGDCRDLLAQLPAGSVHTVVTSPPYFGLRDYGTGEWEGGDETCDHAKVQDPVAAVATSTLGGGKKSTGHQQEGYVGACGRCGATRKDQQLGLEPTPQDFVDALVQVFRGVRRVLRDDGTVWLNLGDSYAGSWGNQGRKVERGSQRPINGEMLTPVLDGRYPSQGANTGKIPEGADYKPKDLIGIPWMVAFALRVDGWYLRSDIVWHKPNPMPESVTDRPTRSHEFIFLLTKSSRYHYDADSIREPGEPSGWAKQRDRGEDTWAYGRAAGGSGVNNTNGVGGTFGPGGRNKRDVWTVSTKPYPGAHFATFSPELITPCVLAGCPERACSACGAPWERIVERTPMVVRPSERAGMQGDGVNDRRTATSGTMTEPPTSRTIGFKPSCSCNANPTPGTVLDPFAGAGTTGLVAVRNRRAFIGLELNPEYAQMARDRIATDIRLGHRAPQRVDVSADQIDIFEALS